MGEKKATLRSHWSETTETSSPQISSPIDESPELHDPYSELNLFLTRQVKEEFKNAGTAKKWSVYIQEKLIEKISPEFRKRFPHYRLGVSALKKIWEKVAYLSQTFENQKEALTQEGKLNLKFLIRENLKQFFGIKKSFSFHPYLLAQQLALKITECLAAYDGIRPMMQHMTKTIWAVERHLIPPVDVPAMASPYDEFDTWDKLIIKYMLEITGQNPLVPQEELQTKVREKLHDLKGYPSLESEIIDLLIDNPDQGLENATKTATLFLEKAGALAASAPWIEVEHKINLWTLQGDLVYRCLRIENNQLLEHLRQKGTILQYIQKHPSLAEFALQLQARALIFSKFEWYKAALPTQSTVERFFQWHRHLSPEEMEELCQKQLPLLPFDNKLFLRVSHEQVQSQSNEG